jgi:deoxyribonuclease-4
MLGLNAMEIQLVRTSVIDRPASEEEIGLTPRTVAEDLIVEIVRDTRKKGERIFDLDEVIQKGDLLRSMPAGIQSAKDHEQLMRLGDMARDLDVALSMHTPYYIDFISDDDVTQRSIDSVMWGGMLTQELGGSMLVTHMGLYGDLQPAAAMAKVKRHLGDITSMFRETGIKVKVGIEPSGRQEVVGSIEEIIKLADEVEGIVPVLNFPHLHARGNGSLKAKEDFQKLFEAVKKYFDGEFYAHFSGVEHESGNEIRYTPIKKGDLKFEPLAECILDGPYDMTIISGSPLLEHDAMYMKVILERILARRRAKPVAKPALKKPAQPPKKPAAAKQAPKKPSAKPKAAAKKPMPKGGKKPATKPKVKTAAAKKPIAKGSVAKKPAPKKPAAKKPAAKKPTPKKAPAAKPKAKKPAPVKAASKPTKPNAIKQAAKKPAAKKPAPKPAKKQVPRKPTPKGKAKKGKR